MLLEKELWLHNTGDCNASAWWQLLVDYFGPGKRRNGDW